MTVMMTLLLMLLLLLIMVITIRCDDRPETSLCGSHDTKFQRYSVREIAGANGLLGL